MEFLLSFLPLGQHSLVSLELDFCFATGCVPPYFFEATLSLNLELLELVRPADWLMTPRHSPGLPELAVDACWHACLCFSV